MAIRNKLSKSQISGFTIVELLIVVVVIGILAAITIVSYAGISRRAIAASLRSDLSSAASQLKLSIVNHGEYPTTIDCSMPDSVTNLCIRSSSSNIWKSYTRPTPNTFILDIQNGDMIYRVTENSAPFALVAITSISNITGTPRVGSTLTAGSVAPVGATATYQWQIATSSGGPFTDIAGATSATYTASSSDSGKYIRVAAIGGGSFWSTVYSSATSAIEASSVFSTGGTITTSGGNRVHTFSPGNYTITANSGGIIQVSISGSGGGGGGGATCGEYVIAGSGAGGSYASVTYSGGTWRANGGGAGTGGNSDCYTYSSNGVAGASGNTAISGTATLTGWTAVTGGGSSGGTGGGGIDGTGGRGGAGGKLTGSLTVSSGQSLTIYVGTGGNGGAGAGGGNGTAGAAGVVTITYPG